MSCVGGRPLLDPSGMTWSLRSPIVQPSPLLPRGSSEAAFWPASWRSWDYIHRESGEYPVLLLDDVASELDDERRAQLFAGVPEGVQLLLTTTSLSPLCRCWPTAKYFPSPMASYAKKEKEADRIVFAFRRLRCCTFG